MSLLLSCLHHRSLYFDIRVIMDVGCHKRGQTFGYVFGTQVQASCNPKTSLHCRNCTLGFSRYGQRHSCNVKSYCDGMLLIPGTGNGERGTGTRERESGN